MDLKIVWLYWLGIKLGLASINYIANGNFDEPALDPDGFLAGSAHGWNGSNINTLNRFQLGASYGQYIDMQ